MHAELLGAILTELRASSDDIEACAVLSADGQVLASQLPPNLDNDRMGAMSAAAMLSLGDRTAKALARGELEQVMVKGSQGYVLLAHAGRQGVLVLLCQAQTRLGMVLLNLQRAAEQIGRVL